MFENENTWANAVKTNSQDEFHKKFDSSLEFLNSEFGKVYPLIINGKEVRAEKTFDVRSPSDTRIILAKFPLATKEQTIQAIQSAKQAFVEWSATQYQNRAKIFREVATQFSQEKFVLAAIVSLENGKNRLEAMGELDETIDFLRFYADQLEAHQGFVNATKNASPNEKTQSVRKLS